MTICICGVVDTPPPVHKNPGSLYLALPEKNPDTPVARATLFRQARKGRLARHAYSECVTCCARPFPPSERAVCSSPYAATAHSPSHTVWLLGLLNQGHPTEKPLPLLLLLSLRPTTKELLLPLMAVRRRSADDPDIWFSG